MWIFVRGTRLGLLDSSEPNKSKFLSGLITTRQRRFAVPIFGLVPGGWFLGKAKKAIAVFGPSDFLSPSRYAGWRGATTPVNYASFLGLSSDHALHAGNFVPHAETDRERRELTDRGRMISAARRCKQSSMRCALRVLRWQCPGQLPGEWRV